MGGGTSTFFGTSQAAPAAAAVAALLRDGLAVSLPVDDVEARMEASGTPLTDDLDDGDSATKRVTPRIDARVALLADNDDTDGDGCTNVEEYGQNEGLGGLRNPLDFWDFFDTPDASNVRDKVVVLTDIFAVAQRFGATGTPGDPLAGPIPPAPAYHSAFDRGAVIGANNWTRGPADGFIVLEDIFAVAQQFGHNCSAAP
jgi:hypothetical protein